MPKKYIELDVEGVIYKKSKHTKKWMKRRVEIQESLKSYKEDLCTVEIKSLYSVQTKFEFHNGFIIVMLAQKFEKTYLALPLTNYLNAKSKNNWLYAICYLLLL